MWTFLYSVLLLAALAVTLLTVRRSKTRVGRLEKRLEELQAEEDRVFDFLHGIGDAFSEGVRSSELHRLLVESSAHILEAQAGALYLIGKTDSKLTPAFMTPGCPPFVPIPLHILAQAEQNPGALESFLQLQPVPGDGDGLIAACWRSGEVRLVTDGANGLLPAHSAIIGPLIYQQRTLGVLALANPMNGPAFEHKDLAVFRAIAEQSAFALYNEVVYLEASEKKLLDRDLEIARDIQRIMLPEEDPIFPGYDLSAVNHAARHVSGDYFDYIPLKSERLGVAIADVSGKGVPASIIMAMCRSVLRREAAEEGLPSHVLQLVNQQLYPDIKEDMFISMAYLILDRESGQITMARAGHDAPLLYRAATATVEKLSPKGMALGIDSGRVFNRVCGDLSLVMETGDCMLLYTDGATEAMDQDGQEYGLDRLVQSLQASAPHGATRVVRRLAEDVKAFTGGEPKHDDFTLIAIYKK
jgi:sigma-B regulation protein RsbU (phosphoserine phosphatase)